METGRVPNLLTPLNPTGICLGSDPSDTGIGLWTQSLSPQGSQWGQAQKWMIGSKSKYRFPHETCSLAPVRIHKRGTCLVWAVGGVLESPPGGDFWAKTSKLSRCYQYQEWAGCVSGSVDSECEGPKGGRTRGLWGGRKTSALAKEREDKRQSGGSARNPGGLAGLGSPGQELGFSQAGGGGALAGCQPRTRRPDVPCGWHGVSRRDWKQEKQL